MELAVVLFTAMLIIYLGRIRPAIRKAILRSLYLTAALALGVMIGARFKSPELLEQVVKVVSLFSLGVHVADAAVQVYQYFCTIDKEQACREIIKVAAPNQLTGFGCYEARDVPNRWLEVAFGINSCFTTKDQKKCKNFRDSVEKLLYFPEEDWAPYVDIASGLCASQLPDDAEEVNLLDAVQMVTMKTMLKVLFDQDPTDTHNDYDIRTLAKEVNKQWVRSKSGLVEGAAPDWAFNRQTTLKDEAEKIFGKWYDANDDNPFNFILLGYETMWRVVVRCVVEGISPRHPDAAQAWKERLYDFLRKTTRDQLREGQNSIGLTAEHVVFEALSLYPPTRRIARLYKNAGGSTRIAIADVEHLDHSGPTWQPDPTVFRPQRWVGRFDVDAEPPDFLPFGCKPFNCPAKRHKNVPMPFSVSMIALLKGCLVEALDGKWFLRAEDFPPAHEPISNEREGYEDVKLFRVGGSWDGTGVKAIDSPDGTPSLQLDDTSPRSQPGKSCQRSPGRLASRESAPKLQRMSFPLSLSGKQE